MQPVDVKMALINYHELKKSLPRIDDDITVVTEKRYKFGGSIIKMPENSIPREIVIIENLMKMDALKRTLSIHQYLISVANSFITFLKCNDTDFAEMVIDKYIQKMSVTDMENKYCYSNRQINRIVDNLINVFVEAVK